MIHRPLFLASLASLASTGCGAVFFEGEPPTATATVQVERTEGGVVIVEQRPGAGFVMEGGLRAGQIDVVAGATDARYYEVLLKDGGMEVVINPARADDISAEGMAAYEAALASIQDGSFEVPFDAES